MNGDGEVRPWFVAWLTSPVAGVIAIFAPGFLGSRAGVAGFIAGVLVTAAVLAAVWFGDRSGPGA